MSIQGRRYDFMHQILLFIFKGNHISLKKVEKYAKKAGVGLVYEPGVRIKDYFEILTTYGVLTTENGLYIKDPKNNQTIEDLDCFSKVV